MGDPCGSFPSSPEGLSVTSGISTPFEVLFRTRGLITYVLRTRAPLTAPKDCPFDLHVLGPPQTFALSQDQTLQFDACVCHSGAVAPVTGMADLAIDRVPQALAFAVRAAAEGCLASRERFSWLPLPRTSFQGASVAALASASGVKARLIAATFDSSRALVSFFVCGVGTPLTRPPPLWRPVGSAARRRGAEI